MMRWLIACICVWTICVVGFFIIWLIGLSINCVFIPGCISQTDIHSLLTAVNGKSVMVKGTLSAIAIVGTLWFKRRQK